jgi:PKD repeat protein
MTRFSIVVVLVVVASLATAPGGLAQGGGGNGNNNKKPTACFTQSPPAPKTLETVTFSSTCSTDSDGTIAGRAWDLDNDGSFDDGTGVTATRSWSTPGSYTVRLGVVDNNGATAIATKTVTIANRGPVAGFSFTPADPVTGQTVKLTSTSADPDGTVASQTWDLDNDGQFDDATGSTASFTPTQARSYPVAIRVVDNSGAAATASKTFVVTQAPANSPPPGSPPPQTTPAQPFDDSLPTSPEPPVTASPSTQLRWLDPFPVVRIRGRTTSSGVFLDMFTVRAPAGARIELRCAGRGCPTRRVRKLVKSKSGKPLTTRFKALEGALPAGIRISVLVTRNGVVGKYTRFTIRRIKLPVRTDRCLMPGSGRPVACPPVPTG